MLQKQEIVQAKEVNWEEPPLQRWLSTITRDSTKDVYKIGFKLYSQFTGLSATEMIKEAQKDWKLDPLQKKDIVLTRLIAFYKYLTTNHLTGRTFSKNKQRLGMSPGSASTYIASARSFYDTFGFNVRMKGRMALPAPQVLNKRLRLNSEQVKKLVDCARSPRDRAIILVLFQSGMDVSTLCSLKYNHLAKGLSENECPLKLELYRKKRGISYYTFIGKDAIEAIKNYIKDMESRDHEFTPDLPLFVKERLKVPMTPDIIQLHMKETAVKAGFVDWHNNGYAINPVGPHALRESFGSIFINSGCPDSIVDFFLGHDIGDMARAYKEGLHFIWFTDGRGWLDMKTPFNEASERVEIIMNYNQTAKKLKGLLNKMLK